MDQHIDNSRTLYGDSFGLEPPSSGGKNQNNTYLEEPFLQNSFHIHQESLKNLQEESEEELLRDKMPPEPYQQVPLGSEPYFQQ